jgi:hypothetical protein
VLVAEVAGHFPAGLANDLDEVREREAEVLIGFVRVVRQAYRLANAFLAISSMWPT